MSVNPVSGALNLSGVCELQGLPVERAIPAAVDQAAPTVILSTRMPSDIHFFSLCFCEDVVMVQTSITLCLLLLSLPFTGVR